MSFVFRKRRHFVAHTLNVSTGELSSRRLNCKSATCANWDCQTCAAANTIRAIRFAMRGQGVRMMTLTKLPNSDAARLFHDAMLRKLRKLGFKTYGIPVVEAHAQGLVHVHILLKTAAPSAVVRQAFESVRPSLPLSEWSDFHLTEVLGPSAAGYVLKNFSRGLRAMHMELNQGALLLARSRGFFRAAGISSMEDCAKAEGARARAFMTLASMVGMRAAERMTSRALTAESIDKLTDEVVALRFAALTAPDALKVIAPLAGAARELPHPLSVLPRDVVNAL